MERVTLLVDDNNEILSCLLNPETVVMRRTTGVRPRESLSGLINTDKSGDNPLLFTGAGTTTIDLDLVLMFQFRAHRLSVRMSVISLSPSGILQKTTNAVIACTDRPYAVSFGENPGIYRE